MKSVKKFKYSDANLFWNLFRVQYSGLMSFTKIKFTKWIIEDKRTNDSHNYKDGQEYLKLLQIALFFFFFSQEDTERTQTIKHRKNEFVAHLYKAYSGTLTRLNSP